MAAKLSVRYSGSGAAYDMNALLERMLSPLCGLNQRIDVSLLPESSPPVVLTGAELTGVHVLLNNAPPPIGSYHIGGVGLSLNEALIRTFGETTERYAQITAAVYRSYPIRLASYEALAAAGYPLVSPENLSFFNEQQYNRPGFPFLPFRANKLMGWVEGESLFDHSVCLIPAQLVFVGYQSHNELGEARILSGVTTGTAAHRTHERALLSAILELIQIDCAVGHWYSSWPAHEIMLDDRVSIFRGIVQRYTRQGPYPQFYWIPSPDLPGIVIACVLRSEPGRMPAVAVGLGCSLQLTDALYKGWLEALGVQQLASINLLQTRTDRANTHAEREPNIYDLDSNVAWYASGNGASFLDERFSSQATIAASDFPDDTSLDTDAAIRHLIQAFHTTGKNLYRWDLTASDVADLGFVVERAWSPDTISLPLPSSPPVNHPRFKAYGGVRHEHPHPYP